MHKTALSEHQLETFLKVHRMKRIQIQRALIRLDRLRVYDYLCCHCHACSDIGSVLVASNIRHPLCSNHHWNPWWTLPGLGYLDHLRQCLSLHPGLRCLQPSRGHEH